MSTVFSLTLPKGTYELEISGVGMQSRKLKVVLNKDMRIPVTLQEASATLDSVTVSASRGRSISSPQMGIERLTVREVSNIPVLFGERDILKTIQLLPGIKSAGDGNSGFYVRGGAADQNLILLDEATVYNASHLLGFFSTFNSDAIKDITVYKGGMPAQYGGRLSSVLDIKMNDGNNKEYGVGGGIGLISAKINVEGPIQKEKSSFLLSARRTYADMFLKLSSDSTINRNTLYFYDLNAKLNYIIGPKDRIYLSGYFGKDVL
jgi:TonB-dependent Receptor Plug Domain.